jgi:hypothetical protein
VARALREAFGIAEFEDISRVTGGLTSSLVFRIIVRGSPYLLKIITRKEDPTRHYTSMKAAAEAGVAPRVWYTNTEDKISITDFVRPEPFPYRRRWSGYRLCSGGCMHYRHLTDLHSILRARS